MPEPGTTDFPWHRVFHPLCGADPLTLARLLARHGPPSPRGMPAFAVACASALARLPFTLAESIADMADPGRALPPVFIVGHPRSGTTHLHNLLAASGAFTTVPPVRAAMPWETRSLGRVLKPFIDPYLPATRLIDGVALAPDAPTEDEVGLANMGPLSYFHAIYFPRDLARSYRDSLLLEAPAPVRAARARALRRYVSAMGRRRSRPLLLKNPAYTAQVALLLREFPNCRIVHIHRDPRSVFASTRRSLRTVLDELALQKPPQDIDRIVLATYPEVMRALRAQTTELPPDRFAEVAFEDLIAAPEDGIAQLWTQLALPEVEGAADRISAYRRTVSGYRPSRPALDETETETLARLWGPELARYGCQRTTKRISRSTAAP